ncbi:hypothetical protein ACHAXT_005817 [Thalassiosira profunda]
MEKKAKGVLPPPLPVPPPSPLPPPRSAMPQPDVLVSVGSGDSEQDYAYHRVILSSISPVFDDLIVVDANGTSRIALPDKKPEDWELFWDTVGPHRLRTLNTDANIDPENAATLIPWFHQFRLVDFVAKCDGSLASCVQNGQIEWDKHRRAGESVNEHRSRLERRESDFNGLLHLLSFADTFDLEQTKIKIEKARAAEREVAANREIRNLKSSKENAKSAARRIISRVVYKYPEALFASLPSMRSMRNHGYPNETIDSFGRRQL